MKKFLKILGVFLLAVVALLIAAPLLFQSQIETIIKNKLNGAMNAQIDFAEVDLSLFSAFPDARVSINELSIINKEPFLGDTLFYSKAVKLDMPVSDLFNDPSDPIHVNELILDGAIAQLKVNEDGVTNWDIAKEEAKGVEEAVDKAQDSTAAFSFDLKHYELVDSYFLYEDLTSHMRLEMDELNHSGTGDFSMEQSSLETETSAKVAYGLEDVNYLTGQQIELDADILMDLANQKYTLQDNEAFINALKLNLDGFIDLEEDGTLIDLSLKTPSSDFKNFFELIPETYRKNLEGVTTTGDFTVNGIIKGMVNDTYVPKMDIAISSNNASFKYADLPQSVDHINMDVQIKNNTGLSKDTFINIANAAFNVGDDRLHANAVFRDLSSNMRGDVNVDGTMDLGKLSDALPMMDDMNLKGILVADVSTRFDMNSVEKERYENIKTKGTASLTDFVYNSEDLKNPLQIKNADLDMNSSRIKLDNFIAQTGNTDFNARGTINNLIGFMFQDQDLKGSFAVKSDTFDTSDFMTEDVASTTNQSSTNSTGSSTEEAIKIPSFLNADLDFAANTVLYDNLTLKNVKGLALVRDETLTLNNTTTDIFNGNIGLNGSVTTKGDTPQFNMNLDMANLDIAQSFEGFEMFQQLVPIIQVLQGKLNTTLKLNGSLNGDLTPVMNSLTGDAFAQLLTRDIDTDKAPLIAQLDEKLNFINLKDVNLSDIATSLSFKDGAVQVAPFDFNIKDIKVTASGSHSLTNDMSYQLDLNLPAKYLGKEGSSILSQLQDIDVDNLSVPLPVNLSGTFMKPQVNLNLKNAVTNLTNQIVEIQKQKLKDKGQDAITGAVDDILQGNDPLGGIKDIISGDRKPSTTQDSTAVKKPKDSTAIGKAEEQVKDKVNETVGGLIDGIFGKKK